VCVRARPDHEEKRKRGKINCYLAWEGDKNPYENLKKIERKS